jgi:hypothetical protein
MDKDCDSCKKQKTMECPNSSECYALESKPYWEKHTFKQAKAESPARELVEALEEAIWLLESYIGRHENIERLVKELVKAKKVLKDA